MAATAHLPHHHVLGLRGLQPWDLAALLDRAEALITSPPDQTLVGCRLLQLGFGPAAGLDAALAAAAKRLGAEVEVPSGSSPNAVSIAECLTDPASRSADIIVLRHPAPGAAARLARHTAGAVVDAGGGPGEHPIQALIDTLAIRRAKGRVAGLTVAVCGDIGGQGLARSSVLALGALGAQIRLCGPPTLLPAGIERLGVAVSTRLEESLREADIVIVLPLRPERLGVEVPTASEFFRFFGLDRERLRSASPDVRVLHAGPVSKGLEIDAAVADGPASLMHEQDALSVPVCMAVLETVGRRLRNRTT